MRNPAIEAMEKLGSTAVPSNKTAQLRPILPKIEGLISDGVSTKDIVAALNESGLAISEGYFALALNRLRKERDNPNPDKKKRGRKKGGATEQTTIETKPVTKTTPIIGQADSQKTVVPTGRESQTSAEEEDYFGSEHVADRLPEDIHHGKK